MLQRTASPAVYIEWSISPTSIRGIGNLRNLEELIYHILSVYEREVLRQKCSGVVEGVRVGGIEPRFRRAFSALGRQDCSRGGSSQLSGSKLWKGAR